MRVEYTGHLVREKTINAMEQAGSSDIAAIEINYRFEAMRLQSYADWPANSRRDPAVLAAAGFYYTGEDDAVRCFACGIEIYNWQSIECGVAMAHKYRSSQCPFIRNVPCGNVVPGEHGTLSSVDVCGPYDVLPSLIKPDDLDDIVSESAVLWSVMSKLNVLGMHFISRPIHPQFLTIESRLGTFDLWNNLSPTRQQLAEAGFYCLEKNHVTCCYHCNFSVLDWKPDDDPWEVHAKLSPNCYFLSIMRGGIFINQINGLKQFPLLTNEVRYLI